MVHTQLRVRHAELHAGARPRGDALARVHLERVDGRLPRRVLRLADLLRRYHRHDAGVTFEDVQPVVWDAHEVVPVGVASPDGRHPDVEARLDPGAAELLELLWQQAPVDVYDAHLAVKRRGGEPPPPEPLPVHGVGDAPLVGLRGSMSLDQGVCLGRRPAGARDDPRFAVRRGDCAPIGAAVEYLGRSRDRWGETERTQRTGPLEIAGGSRPHSVTLATTVKCCQQYGSECDAEEMSMHGVSPRMGDCKVLFR